MADGIPGVGGAEDLASKIAPAATPDISGIITELGSFHERVTKESQRKALEAQTKFGAQRAAADVRAGEKTPTLREEGILNKYAEAFNKATIIVHSGGVVSRTKDEIRKIRQKVLSDPKARGREAEAFDERSREHLETMDRDLRVIDPSGKLADKAGLDALQFQLAYREDFANKRIEREIAGLKAKAKVDRLVEFDNETDIMSLFPFDDVRLKEATVKLNKYIMSQVESNVLSPGEMPAEFVRANDEPKMKALEGRVKAHVEKAQFSELKELIDEVDSQDDSHDERFNFLDEPNLKGTLSSMNAALKTESQNYIELIKRSTASLARGGDGIVTYKGKEYRPQQLLALQLSGGTKQPFIPVEGYGRGMQLAQDVIAPAVRSGNLENMKGILSAINTDFGEIGALFKNTQKSVQGTLKSILETAIKDGQKHEFKDPTFRGLQISQVTQTPKLVTDHKNTAFSLLMQQEPFATMSQGEQIAATLPGTPGGDQLLRMWVEVAADSANRARFAASEASPTNTASNIPPISIAGTKALSDSFNLAVNNGDYPGAIQNAQLWNEVHELSGPEFMYSNNELDPTLKMMLPIAEINPSIATTALRDVARGKQALVDGRPAWVNTELKVEPFDEKLIKGNVKDKFSAVESYLAGSGLNVTDFFMQMYVGAGEFSEKESGKGKGIKGEQAFLEFFDNIPDPIRLPIGRATLLPKKVSDTPGVRGEIARLLTAVSMAEDGAWGTDDPTAVINTATPFVARTSEGPAVQFKLANGQIWLQGRGKDAKPRGFLVNALEGVLEERELKAFPPRKLGDLFPPNIPGKIKGFQQ